MPGKRMFRCERLSADLVSESCAQMWRQANGQDAPERLHRCRSCPIGAMHAGAGDVAMNPLRGMQGLCVRCGRTDLRIIGRLVCVSCKNREYEAKKGRNAKGSAPRMHPGVWGLAQRYQVDGEARVIRREAVGREELQVQLLRDEGKRVVFGMGVSRGAG